MGSYGRSCAELYDFFYRDKPYVKEANFIHSSLQKFKAGKMGSLLELGCGTATHTLELEKKGYKIAALDYSKPMLSIAQNKAAKAGSKIKFIRQDMRSLRLLKGSFDAVISLFDSIGYVVTNEALFQTLKGIHEVLRPGGLVILEFWHAPAMIKNYEPVRLRCMRIPDGWLLRVSETEPDYLKQVCNVNYTVYALDRDKKCSTFREQHQNRYFFVQEMAAYLVLNGFSPLKFFPGFNNSGPINENVWHIIVVARRVHKASSKR